jgi:hypothetical protein
MNNVVVEIRKGMVTEIYSDDSELRFIVVDWDLPDNGDREASSGFVVDHSRLESMSTATNQVYQKAVS